jgi:hypothetical protein
MNRHRIFWHTFWLCCREAGIFVLLISGGFYIAHLIELFNFTVRM